jgi:hypothetical protein
MSAVAASPAVAGVPTVAGGHNVAGVSLLLIVLLL